MNTRNVTVPLAIDVIKDYFNDKSIFFLIDYENSKLQEKVLLTYLANLDVPSDIVLRKDFPIEKTFALIDAYMDIKTINKINFLEMIVVHILFRAVGIDTTQVMVNQYLTDDQVDEYIRTRRETVERWVHFLDSTPLFLMYSFKELNDELKVEETFPIIDDPSYVGHNIVNLFNVPGFYDLYMASPGEPPMSFFKPQFQEYMFKGKSFFDYYQTEYNMFIPLLLNVVDGKAPIDPKEVFGDILNG